MPMKLNIFISHIIKHSKLIFTILFIIVLSVSPIIESITLETQGWTISIKDMKSLISLRNNKNDLCVGFTPYHPIFVKDATPLYLPWDYYFIIKDWVSEKDKELYRRMWYKGIKDIINKKPIIIVSPIFFKKALGLKVISKKQYIILSDFLKKHYTRKITSNIKLLVLNSQ